MSRVYKGFFTKDEIDSILEGKDYWMDPSEVTKRLNARNKIMESEHKKQKRELNKLNKK